MSNKEILVSISLSKETIRVGTLWINTNRSKESVSFEYDKNWINNPEKFSLEPALQLTEGSFHSDRLFGSIGDSAPDRWGRVLMRRAESAKTKNIKTFHRTLSECDYLLGVTDEARQGALRFSTRPDDNIFLGKGDKNSIPPMIKLPKLLSATEHIIENNESENDLKLLLAPGSSLGGARPKASVVDNFGNLSIAKFHKKDDEFNIVLWEAVALTLAKNAGINVPTYTVKTVLKKPVLLVRRFDRNKELRIPFLSAMSMLSAKDNEQHSYLEIASSIIKYGANPDEDLKELWRRIVFSIMISNTDDHLRNHGFTYERFNGWRLSPVYDLNPVPIEIRPRILSTSIGFENDNASIESALQVAEYFRLNKRDSSKIMSEVSLSVKQWKKHAINLGIPNKECDQMSSAFELAYR